MSGKNRPFQVTDPLSLLFSQEVDPVYTILDDLEKIIDSGTNVAQLPIAPLYNSIKSSSSDQVSQILPLLTERQREVLVDLDLWEKDSLNVSGMQFWIKAYAACEDLTTKFNFTRSEQFLLYLKGKFTLATFDNEEANYPDHDNFFLTDDQLLIVEFDEDYPLVAEVKGLLRTLYAELGVENAYAHLMKIVSDSYLIEQEEEYQRGKERLREYGLVDYFSALELTASYSQLAALDRFIKGKVKATGGLSAISGRQILAQKQLAPFRSGMSTFREELDRVSDQKRRDYLHFNFVRLINSLMVLNGGYERGFEGIASMGRDASSLLRLGLDYLKHDCPEDARFGAEGVLSCFEFVELYKIGASLVRIQQTKIKKALHKFAFDRDDCEGFLGPHWTSYLEGSFSAPVRMEASAESRPLVIDSWKRFSDWEEQGELLCGILPFARKFLETFTKLKDEGRIKSEYYLNYDLDAIDLEAILISSFVNFALRKETTGDGTAATSPKLGVTIEELRQFAPMLQEMPKLTAMVEEFKLAYGLESLIGFEGYFRRMLLEQLSGYDFSALEVEDFKHVGGPILFRTWHINEINGTDEEGRERGRTLQ